MPFNGTAFIKDDMPAVNRSSWMEGPSICFCKECLDLQLKLRSIEEYRNGPINIMIIQSEASDLSQGLSNVPQIDEFNSIIAGQLVQCYRPFGEERCRGGRRAAHGLYLRPTHWRGGPGAAPSPAGTQDNLPAASSASAPAADPAPAGALRRLPQAGMGIFWGYPLSGVVI